MAGVYLTIQHRKFNKTALFLPHHSCKNRLNLASGGGGFAENRRLKIKLFVTIQIFLFKLFMNQLGAEGGEDF